VPHVSIQKVEDLKWEFTRETGPDDVKANFEHIWKQYDEDRGDESCIHQWGTDTLPQLFEVKLAPNYHALPHAHEQNEVMFILGGEMRVGNDVLKPGSSLMVPAGVLYSFIAGGEGVHFLNFRPRRDVSFITVEDARARQKVG
jgi:hypothetical protein